MEIIEELRQDGEALAVAGYPGVHGGSGRDVGVLRKVTFVLRNNDRYVAYFRFQIALPT